MWVVLCSYLHPEGNLVSAAVCLGFGGFNCYFFLSQKIHQPCYYVWGSKQNIWQKPLSFISGSSKIGSEDIMNAILAAFSGSYDPILQCDSL